MLIGRYYHTLEPSRRCSLPKQLRDEHQSWVVTRGLDGGLFLFGQPVFAQELDKLSQRTFTKKMHRDFVRLMTNDAKEVTPDEAGRIQLPKYLTELAELKKELVIVGSLNKIEIWDRDTYHHYLDSLEPAEELAESINES